MPNDYMMGAQPPVDMRGYLQKIFDSMMPWKGPRTEDIELLSESGADDPRLINDRVEKMLQSGASSYTGLANAFRRFK